MKGPLSGIKVLEMSTFVAAPVSARLLSDLGATVIKVEAPKGDNWRQTAISYNHKFFSDAENPVFDIYNTGKKLISLNLKTQEGMEAFHKLLSQSDVFVTNIRVQALKKLGISYDDLKDKYPSLIYASVLGYGEKGPDANNPAFDTSAFWARSGFLRDMGVGGENYNPIYPPYSVGDTVTGMFLMGEVCAALYRRTQTGKGDHVRSTLFHNAIFTMGTMQIITQDGLNNYYPKTKEMSTVPPSGHYKTKDGDWVFLSGYTRESMERFLRLVGRDDLVDDPKFATYDSRIVNRQELYDEVVKIYASKTCEEWLEFGKVNDFPLIRMNHFSDLPKDEQALANGFLENVDFASGNTRFMPSSPVEMDSVTGLKTIPAKHIGADTEEILAELGYTAEQIKEMEATGAARLK